jgi:hypothetical protein
MNDLNFKFYLFTKDSCGPCGLVKRYINALKDDRSLVIDEIYLEDFSLFQMKILNSLKSMV